MAVSWRRGPVPRLHLVTDDDVLASPGFPEVAGALLETGGARVALHVRGPHTSGGTIYRIVSSLAARARATGARLVVNDRVDVALAAGVGAVQLGRRSLPVDVARRILGSDVRSAGESWVGVSTHGTDEAARAVAEGADWIFTGTIYATPTHPGRPGSGADAMRAAARAAAGTPALAIGGVTPARVAEMKAAGAHGVAVVRGVWEAQDPTAAVREYLEALETANGVGDVSDAGERGIEGAYE